MLLDRLLPEFDFHEVHSTIVDGSPLQADRALRSLQTSETPAASFLMFLRELPARLSGKETVSMKRKKLSGDNGYIVGTQFDDVAGEEITFGFIGKPWNPINVVIIDDIHTVDDFVSFSQPGYVKVAANYSFESVKGGTRVRTESRIGGTSRDATLRFLPYWIIIRLPSGFIRRCMLAALKKKIRRSANSEALISIEGGL